MTETASANTLLPPATRQWLRRPAFTRGSDFKLYILLTLLGIGGYLWSDWHMVTPKSGIGYWLGIVGGTMMLTLLLYPLRKRMRFLSVMGSTRAWFQIHMWFGLIGPLFILYHANFRLGSLNSQVALYSMLLVAGSGIVGRHFYATIHRGLYGKKTSLQELQADLAHAIEENRGLAAFTPHLLKRLNRMAEEMRGCEITQSLGVRRSLKWSFTHRYMQVSLFLTARNELQLAAKRSETVARNYKRLLRASNGYIRDFTRLVGRAARFSFYERLFSLWHVLHLPLFFLLVVSALFHVLAVHMY